MPGSFARMRGDRRNLCQMCRFPHCRAEGGMMKCHDCGEEITRENMTRNWGRTDICDSCLELRGKLVEAIGAGKLTQEQIAYIQKGKYTRRKKIQVALRKEILIADILNALAPLLSQAKAA